MSGVAKRDRHDHVVLEWVKKDIAEVLLQARTALEAFAEDSQDLGALESCRQALHQVRGVLCMVQQDALGGVLGEAGSLLQALLDDRVEDPAECLEALMLAVVEIPLLLDQADAGVALGNTLVSLGNALRTAQGLPSEAVDLEFHANLDMLLPQLSAEKLATLDEQGVPAQLKRLRQVLQQALVATIRGQEAAANLQKIARVLRHLNDFSIDAPIAPLWAISAALVECVIEGRLDCSPEIYSVLREVDQELKRLCLCGAGGLNDPAPEPLLQRLLYQVAQVEKDTPATAELRQRYGLDSALMHAQRARASSLGVERSAQLAVCVVLREELVAVKEKLDLFVRSPSRDTANLQELIAPLQQVASILYMLELHPQQAGVRLQLDVLEAICGSPDRLLEDAQLMEIAATLLKIEETLVDPWRVQSADQDASIPMTAELQQTHAVVIGEVRQDLGMLKDTLNESLQGDWQVPDPALADALFSRVHGGLVMIGQMRGARLIAACRGFAESRVFLPGQSPEAGILNAFADVVSAIEYYLERLTDDPFHPNLFLLKVAEASLAGQGILVEEAGERSVAAPAVTQAETAVEPEPEPEPVLAPEGVDADLVEVFTEEAEEVLETIGAQLPVWQAELGDVRALTEIRRAFHTLKGSGRMVKASVISELSWAVENLLNRLLDQSRPAQPVHEQLVAAVTALLPELLQQYRSGQQVPREDVDQLTRTAEQLANGESVSLPTAATPDAAPEASAAEAEASDPRLPDPQVVEIFAGEAALHLQVLRAFLDHCRAQLPASLTDDLIRASHTLKGSAHMAGFAEIAALMTPVEQMIRDFKSEQIPFEQPDAELLQGIVDLLDLGLHGLGRGLYPQLDGHQALIQSLEVRHQEQLAAFNASRLEILQDPAETSNLSGQFMHQAMDMLQAMEDQVRAYLKPGAALDTGELKAQASRLLALAEGAGIDPVAALCTAMAVLTDRLPDEGPGREAAAELLDLALESLFAMFDHLATGLDVEPAGALIARLDAFHPDDFRLFEPTPEPAAPVVAAQPASQGMVELGDADGEMVQIFLEEAFELAEHAMQTLDQWLHQDSTPAALAALQRDLHTLKGGARMAGVQPVAELTHELESLYEQLQLRQERPDRELETLLLRCHDQLAAQLDGLQAQSTHLPSAAGEIADLRRLLPTLGQRQAPVVEPQPEPSVVAEPSLALDADLIAIFLEEGFDILERAGSSLHQWLSDPQQSRALEALQRDLHTLKGSARMAEVWPVSDLAHELEFIYEQQQLRPQALEAAQVALIQQAHDLLATLLDCVKERAPLPDVQDLQARLSALRTALSAARSPEVAAVAPVEVERAVEEALPLPVEEPAPHALADRLPSLLQEAAASEPVRAAASAEEMIKVPAALLENLVNLAGETAITRSRIEQQVSDFNTTLVEMESTIFRLRDQLRRLDMETQAQIISRHQVDSDNRYEDFDPLEMDRYSQLQQLSRSLFESASDLMDLRETLSQRRRQAESLLNQQGRTNTELQEGLMRTRMVPFDRMVPRLRRIVRQVAGELGKRVELQAGHTTGEMDRTVLERVIAPLEHMLRNAVDHGIESVADRRAAGKSETGLVRLDVVREGGDILITLSDDGRGVNIEAVREKARARGLLKPGVVIEDQALLQMVFESGLSTAAAVTQISGRGVGLDVAHSEIKKLGGSVTLNSIPGKGTRFVIQLPFTVAVNRALMVSIGEDSYAVPLSSIEGLTRVSAADLQAQYASDSPVLEHNGHEYQLRYLGTLLDTGQAPKLVGHALPLPVLLLRTANQAVAIQVDSLAGSREIVVKGLGAQFAAVPGLSGATLLGDGRVVVILDLPGLLRNLQSRNLTRQVMDERDSSAESERPKLVMVVDDSVTVRKVTSRLLERNGMNVVTARDGVDAIALLQEHHPDIMLLDIEMPRMDGFEVATLVRHDERLQQLPIVMITSRSGDKHRERALSIGVNDYLGKPFQESELLETINRLVEQPAADRS